jgi:2-polyprenyl-3-methyl-5-hydroxy-6-metoxy-1,4-benzoquinol methylase
MPIPLHPTEIDAFLTTHRAPAPHLDLLTVAAFRTAVAGVRLGVFDALAADRLDAPGLGARLGTDPDATGVLADALVSLGYLTRDTDGYANGPAAARWLVTDQPGSYAPTLLLWHDLLFGLWADVESTVRTGRPRLDFYGWLGDRPETAARFQTMLATVAGLVADEVAALLPADATGRVLDVGGGHGRYAEAVCQRHPDATVTVLDPAAQAVAHDRISVRTRTWQDADWGGPWDAVLLFNVLHGHSPADNGTLLATALAHLRPGGVVAVLDNLADPAANEWPTDAAFVGMFSLNLLHTQGGRIYRRSDIEGWLAGAGFDAGTWQRLERLSEAHLLIARKPA